MIEQVVEFKGSSFKEFGFNHKRKIQLIKENTLGYYIEVWDDTGKTSYLMNRIATLRKEDWIALRKAIDLVIGKRGVF